MSDFFKNLKNGVIEALFPSKITCELCGRDVFSGETLCKDCALTVEEIGDDICERCGRENVEKPYGCKSCEKSKYIDLARSVFLYDGGAERLVKKFKYDDCRYLSDYFAEKLKSVYIKNFFSPDIITFVPMTVSAEYDRGYNQSELLAQALSEKVGVSCLDLLRKTKKTSHQAGLDYEERQKNLNNAFVITDRKAIRNKKILLVDDVLTTGATADEIAKALKGGGAESVYLITIASVRVKNGRADFSDEEGEKDGADADAKKAGKNEKAGL